MAADQEGSGGQGHDPAAPPGGGVDGVLDRRGIVTSAMPVGVRHRHPGGGPRAVARAREAARRYDSGRPGRGARDVRALMAPMTPAASTMATATTVAIASTW